jgi:hypothetical protein
VAVPAVGVAESVTITVKLEVATVVGVPVIAPVAVFSVSPAGRVPTETDQAYGVVPPVAARVWLYAVPTVPAGSDAVLMLSTGGEEESLPQPANIRVRTIKQRPAR